MHRNHIPKALLLTTLVAVWSPTMAGVHETQLRTISRSVTADAVAEQRLYIVQMDEAPAVAMLAPTLRAERLNRRMSKHERIRFDPNDNRVRQYVNRLRAKQDRVLLYANALHNQVYSYSYTFNGMAVMLTPKEAERMRLRKGVTRVWEDRRRSVATSDSPAFLGLLDADGGLYSDQGLTGEGIIIGIIDSGIAPGHPSMSDREQIRKIPRLCRSTWSEESLLGRWLCSKYREPGKLTYDQPPDDWRGVCETGEGFNEQDCNNKLIGARFFRAGFEATSDIDPNEFNSPADADGHGTHVASIAAGNLVEANIYGRQIGRIRGMAPRARVAIYKACWLTPGATRASCSSADLQKAIEMAVIDGVDVISYSIGDRDFSLSDPEDLALLTAADAGIVSAVAAGNDGPGLATVQSPSVAPWVISVGATSRAGNRIAEGMRINQPESIARDYESREASFTPTLIQRGPLTGALFLSNDGESLTLDNAIGTVYDACSGLLNGDELSGNIALIQRGGCDFDLKISNAQDAGAVAAVVFNNDIELLVMAGSSNGVSIPAIMIGQADGQLIRDKLLAGDAVEITLDKSIFVSFEDTGNVLSAFSGRGPDPSFLKPDLVAPGVQILGGQTPDVANGYRGERFQYLSGTSQAAPHVAGIAALLKEAHPDWSAAEIKSALMTTARQNILLDDRSLDVSPFDIGAGHMVPNAAFDPGLLYDTATEEYDAFLCGIGEARISLGECVLLELQDYSERPEDINLPSIAINNLITETVVTRRVRNTGGPTQFQVELDVPDGISIEVTPDTLLLGANETLEFTVRFTSDGSRLNEWLFGSLTWKNATHEVYSPFAVQSTFFQVPYELTGSGASGSVQIPVQFGYNGNYVVQTNGLHLPCKLPDNTPGDNICTNTTTSSVRNAFGKSYEFRIPAIREVKRFSFVVPNEDDLYMRIAMFDELTDGDDDLDIYLFYCNDLYADDPTATTACDEDLLYEVGYSNNDRTSNELIELDGFNLQPGTYLIDVHGYDTDDEIGGPGAEFRLYVWSFGTTANVYDANNKELNITGNPSVAVGGTAVNLTASWQNLTDGLWLGGISHSEDGLTTQGLTVIEINNNAFTVP